MPIVVALDHRPVTSKTHHCALLQGNPCLLPCEVVAIWGVLLVLLAAMSAAFGNSAAVLALAGSAAGGVLLLGGAVWLHWRLRRRSRCLRQPARIGGVALLAVAMMLAGLSLAFGGWLLIIAVVALAPAAGLEVRARRRARTQYATVTVPAPRLSAEGGRRHEPVTAVLEDLGTEEWERDSRKAEPAVSGAAAR